jgi:hypothetical protein
MKEKKNALSSFWIPPAKDKERGREEIVQWVFFVCAVPQDSGSSEQDF